MRLEKIISIFLLLIILIGSVSCGKINNTQTTVKPIPTLSQQFTNIAKGTGKISASSDNRLAFKNGGQITRIFVKEGEAVKQGDKLAKLDTSGLEVSLAQARVALDQSQLGQAQARVVLDQAQLAQAQAKATLDQAKLAQIQANSALAAAQFNLDKTQAILDIKNDITNDEWIIKAAQVNIVQAGDSASVSYLSQYIKETQIDLLKQQKKLSDLLSSTQYADVKAYYTAITLSQQYDLLTVEDIRMKQLAVEAALKSIDQSIDGIAVAQKNLNLSTDGIAVAQKNLDLSSDGIALAQTNSDYIQKQISESTLVAPFNGIVVELNVKEGDIIPQPSINVKTVLRIVNPASIELTADIDEEDIAKVKNGQTAEISLKALQGNQIKGRVTHIAYIPKIQLSGQVQYEVTIVISGPVPPEIRIGMSTDVVILLQ
jgi:HlyD family secretion protein